MEDSEGAQSAPGASADTPAMVLGLTGAGRTTADAYLKLQMEEMRQRNPYEISHFRLRRFSGWAKAVFELSIGLLALALVAGISLMVWNAAHSDGLVIESFSVPPDLAARGVTGQAIASRMLDRLTAMQNVTKSNRPAKSYASNWGNDIKVEIPDTGVSVGEAYRFLRNWLGQETRISGEISRTSGGLELRARTGGDAGAVFTGPESDIDGLVVKAAEHVYGATQPYRYATYLYRYASSVGQPVRYGAARAVLIKLTDSPDREERAWAWNGLAVSYRQFFGNNKASLWAIQKAVAEKPDFTLGFNNLAYAETLMGHAEAALAMFQKSEHLLARSSVPDITTAQIPNRRLAIAARIEFLLADYAQSVSLARKAITLPEATAANREYSRLDLLLPLALQHDGAGARGLMFDMPAPFPEDKGFNAIARLQAQAALEDWRTVVGSEVSVEKIFAKYDARSDLKNNFTVQLHPFLALARAKLGDAAGAQALIAATPGDCYNCVRLRGVIAALAAEPGRADYWFARAIRDAPSIPLAYADWGQALLARGKSDEAIEKFKLSSQKGPRFADPLEGWGEALMAKNQSHLALAKFKEAEKYAPNWGRLHLKWGEALVYAGKKEEAKAQFARAAALDLTPSEKSELAQQQQLGKTT